MLKTDQHSTLTHELDRSSRCCWTTPPDTTSELQQEPPPTVVQQPSWLSTTLTLLPATTYSMETFSTTPSTTDVVAMTPSTPSSSKPAKSGGSAAFAHVDRRLACSSTRSTVCVIVVARSVEVRFRSLVIYVFYFSAFGVFLSL